MATNGIINVSVSNHYRNPGFSSEIVTQGILGEEVEILGKEKGFAQIRQNDGYESWIDSDQVTDGNYSGEKVCCTHHFVRILKEPSGASEGVKDAVIGCNLRKVGENSNWYQVQLPSGEEGWLPKIQTGVFPEYTINNIIQLARNFLGYQYFWGGKTPKGFDCSGFVQTIFGLHGITLDRDAWQQQKRNVISDDFNDAEPGDLLFFAKTPERVTHVALSIGNARYIHASGWIRINSLDSMDADFNKEHLKTFVSVNRYPA